MNAPLSVKVDGPDAREPPLEPVPPGEELMEPRFADRHAAGRDLAARLTHHSGRLDVVVLGLPRGGVPVAYEVARALRSPFDVFVVRKLGVPGHEELAMGAIASGGAMVLNNDVVDSIGIGAHELEAVALNERRELERRERLYRRDREPLALAGHTVIVVDDGLATGATMRAAVSALRRHHAASIVVAVPTAAPTTAQDIGATVEELVCVFTPDPFTAVGVWYRDFSPTTDDEVRELLESESSPVQPAGDSRDT